MLNAPPILYLVVSVGGAYLLGHYRPRRLPSVGYVLTVGAVLLNLYAAARALH